MSQIVTPTSRPSRMPRGTALRRDGRLRIITAGEPSAAIVSIHGGGFVAGSAAGDDLPNARLARLTGRAVVSPEYRLVPDHTRAETLEDCVEAVDWAKRTVGTVALLGDSAGAFLALEIADRVDIESLILLEPVLDPTMASESMRSYADGPVWTANVAWDAYLAGDAAPDYFRAEVAATLPPTLVIANPADPVRDEALAWSRAMWDAGLELDLHVFAGTVHGGLRAARRPGAQVEELVARFIADHALT